MPHLARITVYPIKSLDGAARAAVQVLASGALADDRRLAMYDAKGVVLNGKRSANLHRLRSEFDDRLESVRMATAGTNALFHLERDRPLLCEYLAGLFGMQVELREDRAGGFPDDTESPGPTVVSSATLETVAGWFPGMGVEEVRRRFRANLEIDGVEPFWEDRLFGEPGVRVPFRIGAVRFLGNNPCQRCVVPTRDPDTGDVWPRFAREFIAHREATLPAWAARSRFDHFNRLTVNTLLDGSPGPLRVGDEVRIEGLS